MNNVLPSNTAVVMNNPPIITITTHNINIGSGSATLVFSANDLKNVATTSRVWLGFGLLFGIGVDMNNIITVRFNGSGALFGDNITLDISKHRQIVLILNRSEASISLICDNVLVKKVVHSDFGNIALNTLSEPLSLSHFEVNEKAISRHFFNYALTPAEVSLLWNSGRPDRAVLPDYMKWGSNVERVKNGTFDSGTNWIVRGGSSISDGVATVVGLGSISSTGNNWSICQIDIFIKTKSFRITLDVKYKSGTDTGALQVGVGYWIQRSIIPSA
jgi:hypothetical protein